MKWGEESETEGRGEREGGEGRGCWSAREGGERGEMRGLELGVGVEGGGYCVK